MAEYLIDELHVDPKRLVLSSLALSVMHRFGHSLGSAVSVFVSLALLQRRQIRVAGLILQVGLRGDSEAELLYVDLSRRVELPQISEARSLCDSRYSSLALPSSLDLAGEIPSLSRPWEKRPHRPALSREATFLSDSRGIQV